MVRETRHLWVGNLPDNIREDRIKDHFKRYGRVQNVKLLGRAESASAGPSVSAGSGVCAAVAFMDIKSASKAHNAEHVLDERTLTTEYYEPAAIPSAAAGAPSAGSSPAGSGYSGSSSSVNSAPTPASVARYHLSGGEEGASATCAIAATAAAPANWRGTNDSATEYCRRGSTPAAYGRYQRNSTSAPYATPPSNVESRTPHHRWYASGERGATGGESTPSTPGGGTESGRRRRSGSGSSRSESSSPEPSDASRASTPAGAPRAGAADQPPHHHAAGAARTPPTHHHHQWSSTASGRPLAICVRNLPTRSTDSSLKDGLYHEYKKHGKVVWVKVVGQNADRYAVVRFKKPSDVEKALEVSQDKLFFGCKISVAPHQSCDEDADTAKPYETDIDEYHPKATRTLFIGNLEKDVTQQQLRDKFKHFGRIIEIDIKKGSGGGAGYAFCQYASISSVVEAIRAMDGEYVGGSRVKLGFGKPVATTCVWVDGLTEHTEKQEAFYEQLEKHGGSAALSASERLSGELTPRYIPSTRHEPLSGGGSARFEGAGGRSRGSSYGRAASRTPRYSSLEHYDPADYAADRRYRVYDELGSSPQADETPYEDRLQSVVVSPHRSRRHRRDSSPEDRKHSKERHRSGGATCSSRRSRSGSRGCVATPATQPERHSARRRHRRRRDGTPLRDEPVPCEPRRLPPPPRPALPMYLPLPKFAAQLLRAAPPSARPPPPAPAPASPPRAPSASSSSAGSAPHSPSLEERIRSLDEKYEKWSGSRALPEAPDRARLRHRLLEVDINEVKPSEVVRSLLAKRSVFDEDSERLEGAVRAPSPGGSPRARLLSSAPSTPSTPSTPRALRYPFPAHPPPLGAAPAAPAPDADPEAADRPSDPRLNRPERTYLPERLGKINESDYRLESRIRLRTPSTDKPADALEKRPSPKGDRVETVLRKENVERRRLEFLYGGKDSEVKASFEAEEKEVKEAIEKINPDFQSKDKSLPSESGSVEPNKLEETQSIKTEIETSENVGLSQPLFSQEFIKTEVKIEKEPSPVVESSVKCESVKSEIPRYCQTTPIDEESKINSPNIKTEMEKVCKDVLVQNHINKEVDFDTHLSNLNALNSIKSSKEVSELSQEFIKSQDKNGKERYNQNVILEAFHTKLEKENIEIERALEKDIDKKILEVDKNIEDRHKSDREKSKHMKDKIEKERQDEKSKNGKSEKVTEKCDKEKKSRDDTTVERLHHDKPERVKLEKELEKIHKEKNERDSEKSKHSDEKFKHSEEKSKHQDEKSSRHDHHRKDKSDKDRRKECVETETSKGKKEDKHKNDRRKDSTESKRDCKKDSDSVKSRKSSRDETFRDLNRKDSTDSSASRTSHESSKTKDVEHTDVKEETKCKSKLHTDLFLKQEHEKDLSLKPGESIKTDGLVKIKSENKEEKDVEHHSKDKKEINLEPSFKCKNETSEKQRHYSLDSPSIESKRKERLNSCSSLPPNIGIKRRMSSQDSLDSLTEDVKKSKNDPKGPERRDSKDSRSGEKHKTAKFNKGHFAKIIESKTKDDKKNQVKPPDDAFLDLKDIEVKDHKKPIKKSPSSEEDKTNVQFDAQPERLQHDIDFLATLELRSSEEDEMQKAIRNEMKEKKRIQQLQQIQQLQMQQGALHQAELMGKMKDEKKQKSADEKRKESAREKRMSTDRKSRDEKSDSSKSRCNKARKNLSTDSSDSDEPKKQHSIFDIVDDEPMYISMYDKVKARSCKNMQKQEEEKRQEKIKAKFCQLKQSRAKREEKKRSSWDEDSDSEQDRRKSNKTSMETSSDDEHIAIQSKKREKSHGSSFDYDRSKMNDYFSMPSTEEDSRNKLSRKNSRTRIISDTSDDEISKRSKSPGYFGEMQKEFLTDYESLQRIKDEDVSLNDVPDKVKKNSLLNLFGKSDSDDSKLKSSLESNDSKNSYVKALCNDFSSESESMISNRNIEIRKKHKKKQKKHKSSISEDDIKVNDVSHIENEFKQKNSEKNRRHGNKKEKRKDKIRVSVDAEESRDEKVKPKKDKKILTSCFDSGVETNSIKKDGKMEDIFGPISDDSDREVDLSNNKLENSIADYTPTFSTSNEQNVTPNNEEAKTKDEHKRKKEKRKKERRLFAKDDENSLDVDAAGKAIEARLFADDDSRVKMESLSDYVSKNQQHDHNYGDMSFSFANAKSGDKHDKLKRDNKEKKKKKKRSKEDRQSRKEHHHHLNHEKKDKHDFSSEKEVSQLSPKTMLLNIPLPNDIHSDNIKVMRVEEHNSVTESPSLPRLTDSPPVVTSSSENTDVKRDSAAEKSEVNAVENSTIEINDIPMPPPIDDVVQDISEVPLPEEIVPNTKRSPEPKSETFVSSVSRVVDNSEDAVRSISNLEKDTVLDKPTEKVLGDNPSCKVDKKTEEKPRAIISQEETEDAVAALLGESFGGKVDTFANCYDEADNSSTHQGETESTVTGSEIVPEEDAEEMRQAVQNLNACEMEMKPDTPVSDNDLLLIDTDTEENDDAPQENTDRVPSITSANNSSNVSSDHTKPTEDNSILPPKQNVIPQIVSLEMKESSIKISEADIKVQATKSTSQQITSTATPVITSWTLTNNKLIEPQSINIQSNQLTSKENCENKPTHITANIVQIKAPQNQAISTSLRPIITPNRVTCYNHIIRPQVPNMQPPTIKIPEPHILYQKPSGIVISPRMSNDPRLQSPKASPQGETMSSPCLTNMAILSSPQNLNSVGIASANTIQQRSPGQVTVVRMQQPPLSPIQAMHLPHGARTMVSPNRPNSVLVQTQGSPLHFNRVPVTPVLAPLSKQININNMVQNKGINVSNASLTHQQKVLLGDARKNEHRNVLEHHNDSSKIILSPTSLQHSTNPTVMAQNRLISMQNAVHAGNMNSAVHLTNKVVIGNVNHLSDKRENQFKKSESNHIPFGTAPIIHVAGVNHSTASIIHGVPKSVMCSIQEQSSISRSQGSNVIHTLNSPRLLTTAPISNVIQIETSKGTPSVLSMATMRSPTVLTKLESSSIVAVTNSLTNVVMTPLSLKASNTSNTIRLSPKEDSSHKDILQSKVLSPVSSNKPEDVSERQDPPKASDVSDKPKDNQIKPIITPETDFEELLKDNTNEIKISNDPEKKLEINVGKMTTTIATNTPRNERKDNVESSEKQRKEENPDVKNISSNFTITEATNISVSKNDDTKVKNSVFDNNSSVTTTTEEQGATSDKLFAVDKDSKDGVSISASSEDKTLDVKPFSQNLIFPHPLSDQYNDSESQLKNDDNDPWSSKDLNIESVIKKVDSLCNDSMDNDKRNENPAIEPSKTTSLGLSNSMQDDVPNLMETSTDTSATTNSSEEMSTEKSTSTSKRGGRSVRGKKSDKVQDRVQTRQIAKTPRGATSAKRGRGGRAKVDKTLKNIVNNSLNNIPGDVYDFHEDSGDESASSANKSESRPRLILTIKSPLSGQTNAIATSTLSITPKDQPKTTDKVIKDEKPEDFVSPLNTRKSRRLLEKDVQRSTVDDVIEDVVKGTVAQNKGPKDVNNKKRQTRVAGAKTNQQDKGSGSDTRKSPRGVKRTRDRSLSDASVDSSSDEKIPKKEDSPKDPKVPKLGESLEQLQAVISLPSSNPAAPVSLASTQAPAPAPTTVVTSAPMAVVAPAPAAVVPPAATAVVAVPPTAVVAPAPVAAPTPAPAPTPIMKPPKKMISEISAKLASAFEAAASAPVHPQAQAERIPMEVDKPAPAPPLLRNPELASAAPASEAIVAATGDARASAMGVGCAGEAAGTSGLGARRGSALAGGAEASDARVQSPALPHRPPSAHRLPDRPDRPTPLLIRGEAREGDAVAVARRYAGTASLPRGAHLPPPSHLAPHALQAPPHHPHAKQVAVVGPHHHHPGAGSRVTITSVPTISPQGQMPMGDGMYPHFSREQYQIYQRHFHATQHEARATPSPYTRTLEAEGCEAPTPPLELRRPPSARVPRPAHSPAPNERLILYAAGCGRSPPPAHGTSRMPGALPPAPPGPPHASQVPREADSLQMLLRRYPVMWQGLLALKNDSAAVQMHFVGGNPGVAGDTLPRHTDGSTPPLRIAQRMRLEPAQLDQVHRKMKLENEHCILLALPCGRDHMDVLQQSTNLTGGFITYLQRKQAAGIVNVAPPGHHQAMYTVHIFPSCDFANENLSRIAPDLMHRVADIAHLLIVIATATV